MHGRDFSARCANDADLRSWSKVAFAIAVGCVVGWVGFIEGAPRRKERRSLSERRARAHCPTIRVRDPRGRYC